MYYLVLFQKDIGKVQILVLFKFESKVNAIISFYMAKINLRVQKMNVSAQIIDSFFLETYKMFVAAFQIFNN